jgi:hypothetical protein
MGTIRDNRCHEYSMSVVKIGLKIVVIVVIAAAIFYLLYSAVW